MTPFTCYNCGTPCSVDYLCPGCREPICHRCVHLGNDGRSHEMEMALRTFRCAKCKSTNPIEIEGIKKEDSMTKDGGAAFPALLPEDVRLFIYRVTLHLQENRYKTSEQDDAMFQEAYRLYSRYDVENRRAGERKEGEE